MRLTGKQALVTGAASGIGAATARRFAEEGAAVMLADLDAHGASAVAAAIKNNGGRAESMALDVRDDGMVEGMVAHTVEALGGLNVLVNNAGLPMVGPVETLSGEDWDLELDVNLKSVYRGAKAVWPLFRTQGGGVILSTASVAGLMGMPGQHSYSAAKAGVVMLTKCMALDGAKDGIRVNCVCPGFVETQMAADYFAAQDDPAAAKAAAAGAHPLGRLGSAGDIAAGFVFLASDDASWITGTALTIDGGLTAGG